MIFNKTEMLGIQEIINALTQTTSYSEEELRKWLTDEMSVENEINNFTVSRPPYYTLNGDIFYRLEDLWEWFEQFRID